MKAQELVNFENFLPHALFGNFRTQVLDLINEPGKFPARDFTGDISTGMAAQTVGYT
jgi:hypothetical protein